MVLRVVMTGVLLIQLPSLLSQTKSAHPPVVQLRRAVTRIPPINGKWALVFECPNDCSERKLWIEENASHTRKLVKEYERSLSISWAPDSRLFFVNDASGSTGTLCYIYEPATLKETNLANVVVAGDPKAAQFLNVGHSYLNAKRWINSHELLVVLSGHTDEPPLHGFTLRYRVNLTGRVQKLSQRSEEEAK
jgi:hypothetical protein